MGGDELVRYECANDVVVERLDHVDLVRGSEPVEEMEERDARLERGGRCDEREIVSLLH